ncbi:MAG: monomethylamine:corrinoid methyltransferase [Methanobacteriota archaeon]
MRGEFSLSRKPIPWEFWRRAKEGEYCKTKDFEMKRFYPTLKEKIREHDVKYNPEAPLLPTDDLIRDMYKAAMELLFEVGILCTDTERVIKFEKDEIDKNLRLLPEEIVLGSGDDKITVHARGVEDRRPPVIEGGPIGGPLSEELHEIAAKVYEAYAREPLVDRQSCHGYGKTFKGMPVEGRSPVELECDGAIVQSAVEGIRRAGRPGMPLCGSTAVSLEGYMSAQWPNGTSLHAYIMPNMKTDYNTLCRALHCMNRGYHVWGGGQAAIGGLAGPPEGCAITTVAENIAGYLLYNYVEGSVWVIDALHPGTTSRKSIWVNCVAMAALARHVRLICRGIPYITYAGPCTEMAFHEIAASTIGGTVVGNNPNVGTGKGGVGDDLFAPLHSRFQAQVAQASLKLKREDASVLMDTILKKYELVLNDRKEPTGKKFQECYNLKTLTPSKELIEIYVNVIKDLQNLGLPVVAF